MAASLVVLLAASCDGGGGEAAGVAGIVFADATSASGLGAFLQENGDDEKLWLPETIGGGVAFVDYDQDGWLDAYLTNGSSIQGFPAGSEPADALFRNRGDGTFADVTEETGLGDRLWTFGVMVADVDGDGFPDLYLTNWGPNVLHLNRRGSSFRDATDEAGVGDSRWSTGACFLDADRDGDLDLYVANYVEYDREDLPQERHEYKGVKVNFGPRGLPGARDTFFRNEGEGRFVDATAEAGISSSEGYGFQAVAFDYDDDGFVDCYVGNDSTPNYLWHNDGLGRFEDRAFEAGVALSKGGMEQAGMGVAVGDADGDGRFDLFITNFSEDYHTLYHNDGGGFFGDASLRAHVAMATLKSLGWGCGFADLDNDADLDLFCANGHVYPQVDLFDFGTRYRQKNQLFENDGGGVFREITGVAGPGFGLEQASRGTAIGDYDNDGDLDLLFGNIDGSPALLRNDGSSANHWIKVRLVGPAGNRDAIGARVTVTAAGRVQVRPVGEASGFLSSNDPRLHFGLGEAASVERLEIHWPDGTARSLESLPADRLVVIEHGGRGFEAVELPASGADGR